VWRVMAFNLNFNDVFTKREENPHDTGPLREVLINVHRKLLYNTVLRLINMKVSFNPFVKS